MWEVRDLATDTIARLQAKPDTLPWTDKGDGTYKVESKHGLGWWNVIKCRESVIAFQGRNSLGDYPTVHEAMAACELAYRKEL